MGFFKKDEEIKEKSTKTSMTNSEIYNERSNERSKIIKKKRKIGIRNKGKKGPKESTKIKTKENSEEPPENMRFTEDLPSAEKKGEPEKESEYVDIFVNELPIEGKKSTSKTKKSEEEWSQTKRKKIYQKDMSGKPVYLEDTGEKIGTVFGSIYDKERNLIGYKIKDNKSESILSLSKRKLPCCKTRAVPDTL